MKVTIKDVAREANVAPSTVSRVLSNSSRISEETKKRVNEAIEKLKYVPNAMARGLAKKRTNILAVIVPSGAEIFDNQFFVQAMKGISVCAEEQNYYIMYAFQDKKYEQTEWIKRFIESNLIDGICLLRVEEKDSCINYLKEINFPFVVIGRQKDLDDILWVDNDNHKAVYDLVNLLIKKGNKKIGYVGAKKNLSVSIDRLKGYKDALKENGIDIDDDIIYSGEEFSIKDGEKGAEKILKSDVTAIVASDDLLAFGVQNVMKSMNREKISIVGFNNVYLSAHREQPLASVDINAEELGYNAIKLLVQSLVNENLDKKHHIIETKLIERQSL